MPAECHSLAGWNPQMRFWQGFPPNQAGMTENDKELFVVKNAAL